MKTRASNMPSSTPPGGLSLQETCSPVLPDGISWCQSNNKLPFLSPYINYLLCLSRLAVAILDWRPCPCNPSRMLKIEIKSSKGFTLRAVHGSTRSQKECVKADFWLQFVEDADSARCAVSWRLQNGCKVWYLCNTWPPQNGRDTDWVWADRRSRPWTKVVGCCRRKDSRALHKFSQIKVHPYSHG